MRKGGVGGKKEKNNLNQKAHTFALSLPRQPKPPRREVTECIAPQHRSQAQLPALFFLWFFLLFFLSHPGFIPVEVFKE